VPAYDVADIESRLAAAAQSWTDDLRAALQPVPGLTTATLAFALGADTVAGTKHLRLAEAGAAVGLGAIPELRTLRERLSALAAGCDPLALQRAFATAMLATDPPR